MTDENKVAELEAKIAELTAQVTEQKAHISDQNQRQEGIRLQRNNERKKVYAMQAVLSAHNIGFDVNEQDLSALEISKDDGSVMGKFSYTAPEIKPELPRASGKAESLSLDDLDGMTQDQINSRWDEVLELSKAGAIK